MGTVINTNIEAIVAQRNLKATGIAFGKSVERLSSGLRINRAADDAAGLAISEKLRAQVKGYNMALRNVQDGVSLIQTGEGAIAELHAMLQRIRELAVQAANGTMDLSDRNALREEAYALRTEVDRVANGLSFNGIKLIDGSASTISVVASPDGTQTIDLVTTDVRFNALDVTGDIAAFADSSAYASAGAAQSAASNAIDDLDTAITALSSVRAQFGAVQNRLEHTLTSVSVAAENLGASESRIRDLDVAAEMVSFTKSQILQQAGVAVLAQANQAPTAVLKLLQ
jgi:flagellin